MRVVFAYALKSSFSAKVRETDGNEIVKGKWKERKNERKTECTELFARSEVESSKNKINFSFVFLFLSFCYASVFFTVPSNLGYKQLILCKFEFSCLKIMVVKPTLVSSIFYDSSSTSKMRIHFSIHELHWIKYVEHLVFPIKYWSIHSLHHVSL